MARPCVLRAHTRGNSHFSQNKYKRFQLLLSSVRGMTMAVSVPAVGLQLSPNSTVSNDTMAGQ
jgi:hypothetical protein